MRQTCDMAGKKKSSGQKLAAAIKKKKIGVYALAEKAGVDRNTIYRLLRDRHSPTFRTLSRIASALRIPIEDLV